VEANYVVLVLVEQTLCTPAVSIYNVCYKSGTNAALRTTYQWTFLGAIKQNDYLFWKHVAKKN
jgi:hypothetical protein